MVSGISRYYNLKDKFPGSFYHVVLTFGYCYQKSLEAKVITVKDAKSVAIFVGESNVFLTVLGRMWERFLSNGFYRWAENFLRRREIV